MSIQQISPNSVVANPAHVNPQVKTDQSTATPQAAQDALKVAQSIKTDTVTISPQALQKLSSDGDTAAKEIKESSAEQASEKLRNKK